MDLHKSSSSLVLHLVLMALHNYAAFKYILVNRSRVFIQFMTSCSLFGASKYLGSLLIHSDKMGSCQVHDF